MQDPLLRDIRRIRARRSKELSRDFKGAIAGSNERLLRVCDVVVSPAGEKQFVTSKQKMYDVYIAPRLQGKNPQVRAREAENEPVKGRG